MALPAENTAWPPAPWDYAYQAYAENEAWYLGDVDALQAIYQGTKAVRATHRVRGQDMAGGVVGAVTRFFWGRPIPAGETRTRLHIPAPADLATLSSDLLFSEPPEVQLAKATDGATTVSEKTQARLDLIANSDAAHATFNTMGELKAALGATVLTTEWDTDIADHVWLSSYAADVIIPEFRKGHLVACTMWTEYAEGHLRYRHLERHEKGMIEHALYLGTESNIGRRVNLADRPETEYLARPGSGLNSDSRILTGVDRLTVSYNLNLPTRAWRKRAGLAATGRSDFAELHPLFDGLDEAWSSWMRDLKLGVGRVYAPESMLETGPRGSGARMDLDREVFAALNMPGQVGQSNLSFNQFAIRVEEHEATVRGLYREILRTAGYSQSAWGDYGAGAQQTATEVEDRDKASERTRDKKALYDKQAISQQAAVALELDGILFPGKGGGRYDAPSVVFPAVSQADPEKTARTIQLLDAASALSTATAVRMAHPDWDDPAVDEEVAKIRAERGTGPAPDPGTFGLNDNTDPAIPGE